MPSTEEMNTKQRHNILMSKSANEFRKMHDISDSSGIDFDNLLLQLNVITLFRPLTENLSGVAMKTANYRYILVNSKMPIGRQNFTIAHELYHLYVQEDFVFEKTLNDSKANNENESFADCFAINFLMPEDAIISNLPNSVFRTKVPLVTLGMIIRLEQLFQVSRMSILLRLKDLKFISQDQVNEYSSNVIQSAYRYGYTDDLYTPNPKRADIISDYATLSEMLYSNGEIGLSSHAGFMKDIGIDVLSKR